MTRLIRQIFRAIKDFIARVLMGWLFAVRSVLGDIRHIRSNNINQEYVLGLLAKYLLVIVICVLSYILYSTFLDVTLLHSIMVYGALYLLFTVIPRYAAGLTLALWVHDNPRITMFSLSIIAACCGAFIAYERAVTIAVYLTCCAILIPATGFILFLGIDSRIKILQKEQLTDDKEQRPYNEMLRCFEILENYDLRHGDNIPTVAGHRRYNGARVAYALKTLSKLGEKNPDAQMLTSLSFLNIELQNCKIENLNLSGCLFVNADLRGAIFTDITLAGTDFRFADLRDSNIFREMLNAQNAVYDATTIFE
jgi:Pentapeptide repeats (8 copies)